MKKLSQADQTINNNLYKNFLEIGLDDGWTSEDKLGNFELFLKIFEYTKSPIEQSSILDVGCGTGDFAYFLKRHNVKQYMGVDIFEPSIKKAELKYPFADFIVVDFLTANLPSFDFVFSSGALTTNFNSDNYQILETWLKKMWSITKKGLVFNLLLERHPGDKEERLFLYDRKKVLEIAAGISKNAKMKALTTDAGCGDGTEELHVYLYR